MNFLRVFDRWRMDHVFQPLADMIQHRFDRDCFWVARHARVITVAFCFVWNGVNIWQVAWNPHFGPVHSFPYLFFLFGMVCCMHTGGKLARMYEDAVRSRPGTMNPAYDNPGQVFARILPIIALILNVAYAAMIYPYIGFPLLLIVLFICLFGWVAFQHFIACTPPPPKPKPVTLPLGPALPVQG